jgi:hypothetical protein
MSTLQTGHGAVCTVTARESRLSYAAPASVRVPSECRIARHRYGVHVRMCHLVRRVNLQALAVAPHQAPAAYAVPATEAAVVQV